MNLFKQSLFFALLCLFFSCTQQAKLPEQFRAVESVAPIYPDYRDIVIPPNIAPLNFMVEASAKEYVVSITHGEKSVLAAAGKSGKIAFDTLQWRELLTASRGESIQVSVFAKQEEGWLRYLPFEWLVAEENIDDFLSYRLIEPGYEAYRQLGLYQRNLTNFDVRVIYENNRDYDTLNNHCVNCHNYQNYSTENMLFHVRAKHGGTVISQNGEIEKVNLRHDSILSGGVYPAWHPTCPFIAFSSNMTGQAFHINDIQKIEVVDEASDLIFYDVERNEVRNIIKSEGTFETFPTWSPDGSRLYYCEAYLDTLATVPDSSRQNALLFYYNQLRYNLKSMSFDATTREFGEPQMEIACDSIGKSMAVPRISPDGRYALFTLAAYGQFHIWHKDADLWIKDFETGDIRPLRKLNSEDADSYHTWSSNGRWIVFSSRRDDGSFTRPYIAYFDQNGRDHKAFILPQEDPESNLYLMKSYNVPELTRDAVGPSASEFRSVIYGTTGTPATYVSK